MLILEAFLKFGAIGVLCALGIILWRDGRQLKTLRYAFPLVLTLIGMLLTTGSESLRLSGDLFIVVRLIDNLNGLFIWLLGLALFDEEFELGGFEWAVTGAYVVLAVYTRLHYSGFDIFWTPLIGFLMSGLTVLMMCHLIYRALKGRKEDLLESRRKARVYFAVVIALVLIASVLSERLADVLNVDSAGTIWITYAFTLPICIWAVLWLLRLQPEALAFQSKQRVVESVTPSIDPRDADAHARLVRLMESDQVFTEHGLSIGDLAAKVDIPAHQLRALINRSLGYQNFSSFLNHYRIKAVQQALSDTANARVPILTLAMDAGFSSLAPFNRAFKTELGLTPTEFRNQIYAQTAQNPD